MTIKNKRVKSFKYIKDTLETCFLCPNRNLYAKYYTGFGEVFLCIHHYYGVLYDLPKGSGNQEKYTKAIQNKARLEA